MQHECALGIPRSSTGVADESQIIFFRGLDISWTGLSQFYDVGEKQESDLQLFCELL